MKKAARVVAVLLVLRVIGCTACAARDDGPQRLDWLLEELEVDGPGHGTIAGEWYLVSLSMAGLAAQNLGRSDVLPKLIERARRKDVRAFDAQLWRSDPLATLDTSEGHVGYLGHYGLLLALACAKDRGPVLGALERRFAAAPDALIETYPGQKWIPDNAVALAAVAIGARCDGREVPVRAWLAKWPVDAKNGLLSFTPSTGPRGSGNGWNAFYLPFVDDAFARAQYEQAQKVFGWSFAGLSAWREYPPGVEGSGDVDSGPLVFGLSPSGTGFALAGASRYGAPERGGMLRTAEAAGMTFGSHYLLAPVVGEAAVLAAKTTRP